MNKVPLMAIFIINKLEQKDVYQTLYTCRNPTSIGHCRIGTNNSNAMPRYILSDLTLLLNILLYRSLNFKHVNR